MITYYRLLEAARKLRQKTQKEVAAAAGISQASLSKAERGLQELSTEAMDSLCQVLDLPMSFFVRDCEMPQIDELYFRKRVTISDKVMDSFTTKARIYSSIIEDIMSNVELPDYTLPNYPISDDMSPKEAAQNIRRELKVYRGPVNDLTTLIENNGIIIFRFDFGTDKVDGLSTVTRTNRKIMFINDAMPNDRIRFSMAHELGHFVMHLFNSPSNIEQAEDEADEFASEFLMPEQDIRPSLEVMRLSDLSMLKRRWKVSMHALVRRAKMIGAIDERQYKNINIWFSRQGFTKYEPFPIPAEMPTIWDETISLYRSELEYSDNDFMRVMNMNSRDFSEIMKKKHPMLTLKPKSGTK